MASPSICCCRSRIGCERRMKMLAVPATRRGRDRDPRVHRLCRLLGFGLMAVSPRAIGWKCWSSRALISQGGIISDGIAKVSRGWRWNDGREADSMTLEPASYPRQRPWPMPLRGVARAPESSAFHARGPAMHTGTMQDARRRFTRRAARRGQPACGSMACGQPKRSSSAGRRQPRCGGSAARYRKLGAPVEGTARRR